MSEIKEFLTIKEFAKLANKTPQAIYKKLTTNSTKVDNQFNQFVQLIDNKKMINSKALYEIYGIKVEQPIQPKLTTDSTKVEQPIQPKLTTNSTKVDNQFNQENQLFEVLKKQLEEKDKQIEQLQKMLDQEQQLRLVAEQKTLEEPQEKIKKWWQFKK